MTATSKLRASFDPSFILHPWTFGLEHFLSRLITLRAFDQTLAGTVPESEAWNVSHNLKTSHRKKSGGRGGQEGRGVGVGVGGSDEFGQNSTMGGTAVSGWAVFKFLS